MDAELIGTNVSHLPSVRPISLGPLGLGVSRM